MGDLLNSRDLIMCFCTNAGTELYNNLMRGPRNQDPPVV